MLIFVPPLNAEINCIISLAPVAIQRRPWHYSSPREILLSTASILWGNLFYFFGVYSNVARITICKTKVSTISQSYHLTLAFFQKLRMLLYKAIGRLLLQNCPAPTAASLPLLDATGIRVAFSSSVHARPRIEKHKNNRKWITRQLMPHYIFLKQRGTWFDDDPVQYVLFY